MCWLAIYVLQATLVVLGRGPDPRDPDLLILRRSAIGSDIE